MAKKAKMKTVNRELLKAGIYVATFGELGEVKVNVRAIVPSFDTFNAIQKSLVMNGLTQKLNDSHAGAENQKEAFDWTKEVAMNLAPADGSEGKWTVRVPGEGGDRAGMFTKAYAEFRTMELDAAKQKIADQVELVKEAQGEDCTDKAAYAMVKAAALKKYPALGEIMARLQTEAQAKRKTDGVEIDL